MPKLTLDGDARGAIKANNDLAKAQEKLAKQVGETEKKLTKQERAARRIQEAIDPAKRYNRQVEETARLANKGAISIDTAQKRAAQLEGRLRRTGQAGQSAFRGISSQVQSALLGFAGVQQGINLVLQGFREVRAEEERAQQAALGARAGVGELSQLAATQANPRTAYANLLAEARRARGSGAADSQQEAANLLFGLVSAGLSRQDRNFAFNLKSEGTLQNIAGAATAFSALTRNVGAGEVGSFEDFISKSLRASSIAPALANQIPQAAARAGGSAKSLGLSDEFLLAATAILGSATGTAEQGGTQLASFLKQVEKAAPKTKGLTGRNGVGLVEFIASLPESEQGFGGVLGDRAEAVQGFRTLRDNIDVLRTLARDVSTAEQTGLARTALGLPSTDLQQSSANARARAEGSLEVSLGRDAALQNLLDAALAERQRVDLSEKGGGFFSKINLAIENLQVGIERFFGATEGFTEGTLREFASEGRIRDTELLGRIADALDDQTILLEGIGGNGPSAGLAPTRAE